MSFCNIITHESDIDALPSKAGLSHGLLYPRDWESYRAVGFRIQPALPEVAAGYQRVNLTWIEGDGETAAATYEDVLLPSEEQIALETANALLLELAPVLADHPATVPDGGMYYRLADEAGNLALWYVRDSDHVATQLSAHDSEGRAVIRTRYASGAVETVPVGALLSAARIVTSQLLTNMTPAEIGEMLSIHPDWAAGEAVTIGALRVYGGKLYKCIQPHTTEAGYMPPITPALWAATVPENVIAPWVQPAGAHDAYQIGAQVTHDGGIWESTAANNVWAPGVYGWTRIGDA